MQRAAAAAAAAASTPRTSSMPSRFFSVTIPSLPLPPTPPASKWLPIQPSQPSTQQSKPQWLERPNGAPLPFLSHSLEKVVLAGTKPQLIDKMTTEEGQAYPDRLNSMHAHTPPSPTCSPPHPPFPASASSPSPKKSTGKGFTASPPAAATTCCMT